MDSSCIHIHATQPPTTTNLLTPSASRNDFAGSGCHNHSIRPTSHQRFNAPTSPQSSPWRTVEKASFCIATAITVLASFTGCAPSNADMLHFLREHENEVSAIEYRLGIPDGVAVSAPRISEIDGEAQQIHPDGKISFRLMGDVKIVGMTAKELAAKLEVLLSRYYVDPKVIVRVTAYNSKKYYVYGQVGGQGPHAYTGRDTLLDAVLNAGVNYTSWTSRVKVIRPSHGETPVRTLSVNIDQMVKKGDWARNILLEPDDIVYVPPTPLAWLGQKIQQTLSPVAPIAQAYLTPAQIEDLGNAYDENEDGSRRTTNQPRF